MGMVAIESMRPMSTPGSPAFIAACRLAAVVSTASRHVGPADRVHRAREQAPPPTGDDGSETACVTKLRGHLRDDRRVADPHQRARRTGGRRSPFRSTMRSASACASSPRVAVHLHGRPLVAHLADHAGRGSVRNTDAKVGTPSTRPAQATAGALPPEDETKECAPWPSPPHRPADARILNEPVELQGFELHHVGTPTRSASCRNRAQGDEVHGSVCQGGPFRRSVRHRLHAAMRRSSAVEGKLTPVRLSGIHSSLRRSRMFRWSSKASPWSPGRQLVAAVRRAACANDIFLDCGGAVVDGNAMSHGGRQRVVDIQCCIPTCRSPTAPHRSRLHGRVHGHPAQLRASCEEHLLEAPAPGNPGNFSCSADCDSSCESSCSGTCSAMGSDANCMGQCQARLPGSLQRGLHGNAPSAGYSAQPWARATAAAAVRRT